MTVFVAINHRSAFEEPPRVRDSDRRFCSNCGQEVTGIAKSGESFNCPKCGKRVLYIA